MEVAKKLYQGPLYDFCQHFATSCGLLALHDSELLASRFKGFFHIEGALRLWDLKALVERLGITSIEPFKPIAGERGSFAKYGAKIIVQYKYDDWDGSQEHTIGHELREIIGKITVELFPGFQDVKGEELENEADAFAAALLMDKDRFYADMDESGYDPISLHKKYHKSYIGIVSRMATVLNMRDPKEALWASVLEFKPDLPPGYFRSACFHRSPQYIPKTRYLAPNIFFPKRGQLRYLDGSLGTAFRSQQPVYIQRIEGLDFWNMFCLSAIIRPVVWSGSVEKLIVIAVPENDASKIRRQIIACAPIVVERTNQLF